MKLPNQVRGPVTLSKIDYAKNLSEETYAFTATVTVIVDGKTLTANVHNDGHGGPNAVHGHFVEEAIKAYCDTLPKERYPWGDRNEFSVDVDYLISSMVGDAIAANELKKMIAKKTVFVEGGNKLYTIKNPPTDDMRKYITGKYPTARILNDLSFDEALVIYKAAA